MKTMRTVRTNDMNETCIYSIKFMPHQLNFMDFSTPKMRRASDLKILIKKKLKICKVLRRSLRSKGQIL